MADRLNDNQIAEALDDLDGWRQLDGKLRREFRFDSFASAFGFMTAAAIEADKMDHHPEWSNVYDKVVVDLVTHSAGGITSLDVELASRMNALAGKA